MVGDVVAQVRRRVEPQEFGDRHIGEVGTGGVRPDRRGRRGLRRGRTVLTCVICSTRQSKETLGQRRLDLDTARLSVQQAVTQAGLIPRVARSTELSATVIIATRPTAGSEPGWTTIRSIWLRATLALGGTY